MRGFAPVVPPNDPRICAPWLNRELRRIGAQVVGQTAGLNAIVRGEAPDGSGSPLLDLTGFFFKPGIIGGQIAYGDTVPNGTLTLSSTSSPDKGFIYLGTVANARIAFDEDNNFTGFGIDVPLARIHVHNNTGGTTTVIANATGAFTGSWGIIGSGPYDVLHSNDGDTTLIQSGQFSGLAMSWPMDTFSNISPTPTSGYTIHIIARRGNSGTFTNAFQIGLSATTDPVTSFAVRNLAASDIPTTSYVELTYDLTPSEITALVALGTVYGYVNGGTLSTGVYNVTQFYVSYPTGGVNTTRMIRFSDSAGALNGAFASDGSASEDFAFTGDFPLFIGSGLGATSGLRLYSNNGSARIEVGSSAQANMVLFISGNRASQATSILLAGKTAISNAAPSGIASPVGILDIVNAAGVGTINLSLKAIGSQTGRLLKCLNSVDAELAGLTAAGNYFLVAGATLGYIYSSDASGIGSWASPGSLMASPHAYVAKSINYTATTTDEIIFVDCTSAGVTITLPTAVGVAGKVYTIKKVDSSTNLLTLATTSSQTIDGSTTQTTDMQYTAIEVCSDGANWGII